MAEGGARAPVAPLRHHQPQAPVAGCAPPLRPAAAPQQPYAAPPQSGQAGPAPTPAPLLKVVPTPRVLVLRRSEGHGFGFTLRHFIIYPPESVTDLFYDARHAAVGAVKECMDTIFVKSVREGGAAQRAGLRPGDRLLSVDKHPIAGWQYSRVVQLIQQASHTLTLHVVPKEADVLQRYFSEAAHNPETNQRPSSRPRERRTSAGEMPLGLGLGAGGPAPPVHPLYIPQVPVAYRPNNNANNAKLANDYQLHSDFQPRLKYEPRKPIQSNNLNVSAKPTDTSERLYAAMPSDNSVSRGAISRLTEAQPQVPQQPINRVSRRSSEGAWLPAVDPSSYYASPPSSPNYSSRDSGSYHSGETLQNMYRNQVPSNMAYLQTSQLNQQQLRVPVQYTNKLNYDDRRESNTSLTSSATESKDSLSSRESMSTLTGNDQDNLNLLSNRMRKSFEQKEAFLMRPSQPTGWVTPEDQNLIQQKEFYARPQKLHKTPWPPLLSADYSPSKNKENMQDNSLRTTVNSNDLNVINNVSENKSNNTSGNSKFDSRSASKQKPYHTVLGKIKENTPVFNDSGGSVSNGTSASYDSLETMIQEKRYQIPNELQIVSNRMKQFESLPIEDRTALYKSELARLSTKKPEPTVALRRKEFESRGGKRDARSLEAQHSEDSEIIPVNLSGNRTMVTGSKHLTCPPPEGYHSENEKVLFRMRSNSTGSEGLPTRRTHASDGSHMKRRLALNMEQVEALNSTEESWRNSENLSTCIDPKSANNCDIYKNQVPNGYKNLDIIKNNNNIPITHVILNTDTVKSESEVPPNFLPNKTNMSDNNRISIEITRPERPTQLSLASGENFIFPASHSEIQAVGSSPASPSSPLSQPQSPSGVTVGDGAVIRRQKKVSDLGTEAEGAMRRVSYLKATAEQYNFDREGEAEQVLRSAHRRWRPPRFPDDIQPLRRLFEDLMTQTRDKKDREESGAARNECEELEQGDIVIQGNVAIKMVLINNKKASDRSWKHARVVLQGSKLILYRHHHQSPTATGSSESINLQFSMADLAGDYTKRKHVVRVTSGSDGTELLLQASSAEDATKWLQALRTQSSRGQPVDVTEKPLESPAEVTGLSPPPRLKKQANTRTVSPTENIAPPTASPKSKTWKGRVARQFRRMQPGTAGTSPLGSPHLTNSSNSMKHTGAVGIPLEQCEPLLDHPHVPQIVGLCTRAVEERGLHVVGLYRIPGNTASVTALMESLERSTTPDLQDPRWNDVNVVSSLLKAFFRRLPNPLLTKELYPMFIQADKLPENSERVHTIRRLVRGLPDHHYETLKFLMEHLRRVAAENAINKMEARNLAIVFGPTLVRSADDNMLTMVNDMSSQCRIIESLINHMEWYFDEEERNSPITEILCEEELPTMTPNQALLLQNVKKIEGKLDVSTKDIVSSILSAANRKMQRKPRSKHPSENSSPSHFKVREASDKAVTSDDFHSDQSSLTFSSLPGMHDQSKLRSEANQSELEKRVVNGREKKGKDMIDGSALKKLENNSGVKSTTKNETSVNAIGKRMKTDSTVSSESLSDGADMVSSLTTTFDQKLRSLHTASPLDDASIPYVDECHDDDNLDFGDPSLHRSTDVLNHTLDESNALEEKMKSETDSVKSNISSSQELLNSKSKYLSSNNSRNSTSSDKSTKETSNEKYTYSKSENDHKLKTEGCDSESEKDIDINSEQSSPDDVLPDNNKTAEKFCFTESLYHEEDNKKVTNTKTTDLPIKIVLQDVVLKKASFAPDKTDIINAILAKSKLRRSESLNRDAEKQMGKNNKTIMSDNYKNENNETTENNVEKSNSPKLRRSVSLNRSDGKLKRTESLTKNEKTETNILRRKEVNGVGFTRSSAKLKRKNGMPERSIKRRHTVGGTKDFDKDEWVALSCSRTSSPDLPTTITDLPVHLHISPIPLESHV